MGEVYQLPRRYDVRKSPRRLARKPKAPVVELRGDKAAAYALYLQASAIDEAEPERAKTLYRTALRWDPSLDIAWTNYASVFYRQRCVYNAVRYYQRALDINPRQPEALYNLGVVYGEAYCDPAKALGYLLDATAADPDFADAWYNLAMAHRSLIQDADAARCFARYLALEPTGEWADRARNMMNYHRGEALAARRMTVIK